MQNGTLKNLIIRCGLLFSVGAFVCLSTEPVHAKKIVIRYRDRTPQHYKLTARASKIDSRVKEYPKIDYVFEAGGKVQDLQHASVDTRVRSRGKLVIWLMRYNERLSDRLSSYGLHSIQVHYANRWFSKICREQPVGETCRGNVRLEVATGKDVSDQVDIAQSDSMQERALQFVKWLAKNHPQGKWNYYLTKDGKDLRWEDVIMAGSSHGSTTSARFAVHQKVSRVVMFCGPRDHLQTWQSLPSATPANRYFGFSHVLDTGWSGDHYCRSWELLGLNEHGPIVNVDQSKPPYKNTRRLITDFDVAKNSRRAHSSVVPGGNAGKDKQGKFIHEAVWKYLFTHPVKKSGKPTPLDAGCLKDHRKSIEK